MPSHPPSSVDSVGPQGLSSLRQGIALAVLTEDDGVARAVAEGAANRFTVHWAASRAAASELLSRETFPVAVVDSRMYEDAPLSWVIEMRGHLADTSMIAVSPEETSQHHPELATAIGILRPDFPPMELRELMDRATLLRETREGLALCREPCRVLVVEDFPPDACLIRDLLEDAGPGYEVELCGSVGDALSRLRTGRFSAVMSGLVLPDARGLDAIVRFREAAPRLPLIVLSQQRDPALAACAGRFGADSYLVLGDLDSAALLCALRNGLARKARETDLEHRAVHDPLTGLPNRTELVARLRAMARFATASGECLLVIVLDLDGFKAVNDALGHLVGDEVLVQIAQRLTGALRSSDFAARFGGDEFVVLAPRVTCPESLMERLASALDLSVPCAGGAIRVTASIGHATYPTDADSVETILALADQNMFGAKRGKPWGAVERRTPSSHPRRDRTSG